jgi:hypothetical protein
MTCASFTIPTPRPDGGPKIFLNGDGTITCSYDRPRMAMDAKPRHARDQSTQHPATPQTRTPSANW